MKLNTKSLTNFFQYVIKNTNDLIIILSENGIVVDLSEPASNLYGKTPNDMQGTDFYKLLNKLKIDPPILFSDLAKITINSDYQSGSQKIIANEQAYQIQWKITVLHDNSQKYYLLIGSEGLRKAREIAQKDTQKKIALLEQLNKEVLGSSAKKYHSIEEYAYAIHHHLMSIIECMPGNVYWMDKNCIYLGANKNSSQFMGFNSSLEVVGKTYEDFEKLGAWEKWQSESFKHDDLEVMRTGNPKLNVEEPPIKRKDGKLVYFLTSRVPIFDQNKEVTGVVGISIDITERKQMEKDLKEAKIAAEASNRAKSEFIANMSHDVKTPLSGIISMTGTLAKELEEPQQVDRVQIMHNSSKQLMSFFDNCLEMVQMEVGEVALNNENFSIKKLIDEVADLYEPSFYNKKIKFYIHYDRQLPDEIYASRAGLHRIILNLLGNAMKFTKEGMVKITASLWQNPSDQKNNIKIEISDTGIGIPQDKIATIFDRFTRATPSYEGNFEGHGLGLHIAQKFIHLMGGEVAVESELRKGTRFIVTFPFQEPQEGKTKAPPKRFRANDDGKSIIEQKIELPTKATILVVEDNQLAQMAIKSILNKLGYEVEIAATASKVFEVFEVDKYILVFMDVGMPDMSGDAITKNIRRIERAFKAPHIPIIGLTAHADDETKQECLNCGMNEIMSKPLTEEGALMILQDYLKISE
jgi:two-component system, OmpR family, aerobic respiration control sensor histidine kinase ArcB